MKITVKFKCFCLTAICVSVIAFFIAVNLNKTYQAEASVLVMPQGANTLPDSVMENIIEISKSLNFFNQIIAQSDEEIEDPVAELPGAKRKQFWSEKVKIQRADGSTLFNVFTLDQSRWKAEIISSQAIKSLAGAIKQYYGTETEPEIRIVDQPIIYPILTKQLGRSISWSLFWGIAMGLVTLFLIYLAEFSPKRPLPKLIETDDFAGKNIFPEDNYHFSKKSAAPENLPIAGIFDSEPESESILKPADTTREATPEEVKARLNKLLQGNLN